MTIIGKYDIIIKSSTDYYCWAYYYDGVNYCVSDSMTFTTPSRPAPSIEEIVTPEYLQYVKVIRETDTVFIERIIEKNVKEKTIIKGYPQPLKYDIIKP